MRILSIIGTRPEAVKMAPVILNLEKTPQVESIVCVTAQHRQMLDQVLEIFGIVPKFDLDLMVPGQNLVDLTTALMIHLAPVIQESQPDWILAQGDTTTVLVAGILAYYSQIRFGHVEAGLRTWNKWQPFPEEMNRQVVGNIADLHFAPTELCRQNLLKENIPDERIVVTGNPVIDALKLTLNNPETQEFRSLLADIGLEGSQSQRMVLITAHRRENFGQPLENICYALRHLADKYTGDVLFVYPVHLNPNVQRPVRRLLSGISNVRLIDPVDYFSMVHLIKRSFLVLTDSGGLQEEAPSLGVPVLVMREHTERPEGIQAGTARLVGTNKALIIQEVSTLLDDPTAHHAMAHAINPYGDGHAAEYIVRALVDHP
jgi:UDP-N-acetylglucosamine 2-epimerase (non-hydrolysing)